MSDAKTIKRRQQAKYGYGDINYERIDEINTLALHNPTLHAFLAMQDREMWGLTETLERTVIALASQNRTLTDTLDRIVLCHPEVVPKVPSEQEIADLVTRLQTRLNDV